MIHQITIIFTIILYYCIYCNGYIRYTNKFHNNNIKTKLNENKDNSLIINESNKILTFNEIEEYALLSGIIIKNSMIGPYLRLDAYAIGESTAIGYLTAFIRPIPIGLFHLETIQVKNRRQTLGFKRSGWTIDGPGISFLMGTWALRWAYDKGCNRAQLLAVDDSPRMQRILTKLYSRYVKDEVSSILDRIVWGAVGTLMEIDMIEFMRVWTPRLRNFIIEAKLKKNISNL